MVMQILLWGAAWLLAATALGIFIGGLIKGLGDD